MLVKLNYNFTILFYQERSKIIIGKPDGLKPNKDKKRAMYMMYTKSVKLV